MEAATELHLGYQLFGKHSQTRLSCDGSSGAADRRCPVVRCESRDRSNHTLLNGSLCACQAGNEDLHGKSVLLT